MKYLINIEKDNMDDLYPNRHKEIHKSCCKNCPSGEGMRIDPEVEDILKLSKEERAKTVFLCGWRQNKLCKGYCDQIEVDETYLQNLEQ